MKKVAIIGASGMLGSQLCITLAERGYQILGLARRDLLTGIVDSNKYTYGKLRIFDDSLFEILKANHVDYVINCAGAISHILGSGASGSEMLLINSVFPHWLDEGLKDLGIFLIHFSTDCVFSGESSHKYSESSVPDACDLYGRSKLAGEVNSASTLNIRTSIIGHELRTKKSLLEWALSMTGKQIDGYLNAIFSGLTTLEVGHVLDQYILGPETHVSGTYHLAGPPVSKYYLLRTISDQYGLGLKIIPKEFPYVNKALDGAKFNSVTGYRCRGWEAMIADMKTSFEARGPQ